MKQILLLVLAGVIFGFTAETQRTPREEIEIVIVKAPIKQHPYQTEYENMLYPTVRITAGFSTGSGVIFYRKDAKDTKNTIYILTASHVVGDENIVDIELYDNTVITASVVITDTAKDLALLRAFAVKTYSATLAPKDYTPYIFTPVWAVGCSLGLEPRPSYGHITRIEKSNQCLSVSICGYEISAPVLPGNSGGPVYDARTYEVIGIAVWVKVYQGQLVTTMAGIVPINEIYEFLNQVNK